MKTLKFFLIVAFVTFLTGSITAQPNYQGKKNTASAKTESIKVSGNCDMCKDRIEKVAKGEGATTASWDQKTQLLTLAYDPAKTNVDALSKKIAKAGHDTEKYKASDKAYTKLPECCHYDRVK